MKKDIAWAKKKIKEIRTLTFDSYEVAVIANNKHFQTKNSEQLALINKIMEILNQLDEPEALSQEWIDEHKVSRINNLRKMTMSDVVPVEKLQNLLVPKKGELETKIQELIESYKQEEGAYSNPENGWISGFIEDLKNLVEKEQKYYVDLDTAAYVAKWNGNDQVDIYTDGISGSDEFEFHLTEQEIKDYDERFWPFAVKVEEVEDEPI